MLYEAQENVANFFDHYSTVAPETKHASFWGEGIKIFTPKQMLQRLPIALAQVKVGNKSEN